MIFKILGVIWLILTILGLIVFIYSIYKAPLIED